MKIRTKTRMVRHKIKNIFIQTAYAALALTLVTACIESGGGGWLAGGGIGGSGISIGTISGFGSIVVNDIVYDTNTAQVIVNNQDKGVGDAVVREMLELGMVVRVEGQFSGDGTGKADRIVFSENVKGPVESIESLDSVVKKLVILGQIVVVDQQTRFKNTDFDRLMLGDILQISGWPDGTGLTQATYAAKTDAGDDDVTVKGIITEMNGDRLTMRINQLSIDFSEAELDGFPDNMPATGQLALARGYLDANNVLVAAQVKLEDDLGLDEAEDVEFEGIVAKVTSPQEFILGTTAVQTDEASSFRGIRPDEIFPGARLLVKGAVFEGVLLADEVEARDKVTIEGRVADVDFGQAKIKLVGLSPLVINVNNITRILGDADNLSEIQEGQQIKALGYTSGQARVEAVRLNIKNKASDKVKLKGPVTAIDFPVITIIDVAVDTSQILPPDFRIEEEYEEYHESGQKLFNRIAIGDVVNARGKLSGSRVEWIEIELTRDD